MRERTKFTGRVRRGVHTTCGLRVSRNSRDACISLVLVFYAEIGDYSQSTTNIKIQKNISLGKWHYQ